MGKKVKTEERAEITATFEKDSKRFRRFLIDNNKEGIVGTIYIPKGSKTPEEITISFEEIVGERSE